uniref:uL22 n=1 Tax=Paranosema locustae TaxID=235221 RepID=UPI00187D6DBC|nr:Chain LP0, uL22 [Paranosema locustae]
MKKKYAPEIHDPGNTVKCRIDNARVSFKNTRETSRVLVNRKLGDALNYLYDVIKKKQCVPMKRYARGVGRTAQAKAFKTQRGRWPVKSAKFFIELINNLKVNAVNKNLNPDEMVIKNIIVNKAPIIPGRIHRAYGRINPYNSHPCHIQMIAVKKMVAVPKAIDGEYAAEVV